jgi:hypothetical protein
MNVELGLGSPGVPEDDRKMQSADLDPRTLCHSRVITGIQVNSEFNTDLDPRIFFY